MKQHRSPSRRIKSKLLKATIKRIPLDTSNKPKAKEPLTTYARFQFSILDYPPYITVSNQSMVYNYTGVIRDA